MIYLILLILTCAIADRLIGWGGWGRSKPLLLSIAAIGTILWFAGIRSDPTIIAMPYFTSILAALAFIIWRTPAWKLFGGSLDSNKSQLPGTFARHLLVLSFLSVVIVAGTFSIFKVLPLVAFAIAATGLSYWNHVNSIAGKDINDKVEIIRGGLLGAALYASLILIS